MVLGSRGLRDLDQGVEQIRDAAERALVARRARGVAARAVVVSMILTAAALLLPA